MDKKKGFTFGVTPAQTELVIAGVDAKPQPQPGGDGGICSIEMEEDRDVNAVDMREQRRLLRAQRNRPKRAPARVDKPLMR